MVWKFLARKRTILLTIAALSLSVVVMTTSWRSGKGQGALDKAVASLADPVLRSTAAAVSFFKASEDFLLGWRKLREENLKLREEVARLRIEADEYRERMSAYRRLKAIVGFKRDTGFHMIVAAVIGHDATNLFRTVLINKGSLDGIEKDMAVVTPEGAVGQTIKVYGRSARVLLLTDRSSGIDALVQRTRDQGVVQGLGKGKCEMKYLSRQADVIEGDTVVTSGMGGVFPKGLRIGQVTDVKRGGYLLQKVEVRPSAALDRLEEVIVFSGRDVGAGS